MGFLGSLGKLAGGFLTGGPLGAAKAGAQLLLKRPAASRFPQPAVTPRALLPPGTLPGGKQGMNLPATFPGAVPEPGFKGGLQRFLPGGQTGFAGAPPGYHVNRAYVAYLRATEQGRPRENPFNEPRAVNLIVKNRKMNPLNPDALRRANARQVQAVRIMRRVLRGSGYTIARPKAKFGRRKR